MDKLIGPAPRQFGANPTQTLARWREEAETMTDVEVLKARLALLSALKDWASQFGEKNKNLLGRPCRPD